MLITGVLSVALTVVGLLPAQALTLPSLFVKLADSPTLAHPGIVLIDPATSETVYSQDPDVERAPASVLKLFSMSTVLSVLNPDQNFVTTLSDTTKADTFFLRGSSDPWITASPFEAQKYHRAFSPLLINQLLKRDPGLKSITLEYNNVYAIDIQTLQRYFAGRLTIHPIKVASAEDVTTQIESIHSPPLSQIIEFTLLYSDNVLADRLARIAAHAMGLPTTAAGLQAAFEKTLTALGISPTGLHIYDGNGLSHKTRVSARQVAELLIAIGKDPKFKVILAGLPTAGETGTLKNRFTADAPQAVGLVRAKTGWINTTVSLAGFVTVGPKKYVFAIVANHIRNLESARQAARVTIDQMLGSIARP
jgi:D-alanyl-D-alanine carboxypeptidase